MIGFWAGRVFLRGGGDITGNLKSCCYMKPTIVRLFLYYLRCFWKKYRFCTLVCLYLRVVISDQPLRWYFFKTLSFETGKSSANFFERRNQCMYEVTFPKTNYFLRFFDGSVAW